MFSKKFIEATIEVASKPFLTQRRNAFVQLTTDFPTEISYLVSFSLYFESPKISTKFNLNYTDLDFNQVLGTLVFSLITNNNSAYKRHFLSLPIMYQKFCSIIFTSTLRSKLGEDFMLTTTPTIYSKHELLWQIELPDINFDTDYLSTQTLSRTDVTQSRFPMYVTMHSSNLERAQLFYLVRNNSKVVSNCIWQSVRTFVEDNLKMANGGIIFYGLKNKKFKNKFSLSPIFEGSVEDTKQLFRGNVEGTVQLNEVRLKTQEGGKLDITPGKRVQVNTLEELLECLKTVKQKQVVILSNSQGVSKVRLEQTLESCKILDWLYDDEFNATGCKTEFGDIKFNIPQDLLNSGFLDRVLVVRRYWFGGNVVKQEFNSIKRKWSTHYEHCAICNGVGSTHVGGGICYSCNAVLRNQLAWKNKIEVVGECSRDFSKNIEDWEVVGRGGVITATPKVGTQLKLALY